ncbi:MAG: ABC transporter substrate-binding protein [Clostridia bacterium]|nr:ABC transporter substrate-binding protein [Clostridia bacterium]
MKKILSILLAAVIITLSFAACNRNDNGITVIRYLNFKPEIAPAYEKIADAYEKETGVRVIIDTAANNTYEQTLTAKMATAEAPTLFQINGPKGYANWKDYCADLTDSELYKHLTDKALAIKSDGKVYGIPYVVEGYGIIYNSEITDKYFTLPEKATEIDSMDEIDSFEKLKAVVEDMQKNKEKLGIDGVFASTSLKTGEDWRWQTHLANIPLYYEFKSKNTDLTSDATKTIDFTFSKNYRNIFDLYINNSTVSPKQLGTKIVEDSMAEFALGKCAMVQNGNWAWEQINGIEGNKVKSQNIKYLPIYTGVEGEEKQGLCIGTENYICVNSKADEKEQQAAKDFIYWMYSSDAGKKYVTEDLGFIAPFDTFDDSEKPDDPLAQEIIRWMEKDEITTIDWNFTIFPSQNFKEDFGSALLQYAQGTKDWNYVEKTVVDKWKSESEAAQ